MLHDTYKGYLITLITDGSKNNESWYSIRKDNVLLVHQYIQGRVTNLKPLRDIVDNLRPPYPKMMYQP